MRWDISRCRGNPTWIRQKMSCCYGFFFPSLFNRGKPQNMTRPQKTRLNHTDLKTSTIRKWLESHPAKWWSLGDVPMHWVYHMK
jgi:hypothetical protein